MNVCQFLREKNISHEVLTHRRTFDAQRLAEAVNETGHHVAKTVLLCCNEDFLLAVLPATHEVDMAGARVLLRSDNVRLATEREVAESFPDCEAGAVPPFGSQYGMTTLVDDLLYESEYVVFESNTHDEAVRMRFGEYVELEKPVMIALSQPQTC